MSNAIPDTTKILTQLRNLVKDGWETDLEKSFFELFTQLDNALMNGFKIPEQWKDVRAKKEESPMSEISQDVVETVTVFDRECVKITSDEEINNLGYDVALVHRYNISIYTNKDNDDVIIEAVCDNGVWDIKVGDIQGETYPTQQEAIEDIRNRINNKLQYIVRLSNIVSK